MAIFHGDDMVEPCASHPGIRTWHALARGALCTRKC